MGRTPVYEYIYQSQIVKMMAFKFFRTIDVTLQTIDSYFPNLYLKKAAHWVNDNFFTYIFL